MALLRKEVAATAQLKAKVAGRPRWTLARQEELIGYLFILPSLLGFVVFLVVPMVASLGISFYDWELLTPPQFVGLKNFSTLLTDRVFRDVVVNTVYYTFGLVPLNLVVSLGLALWLNTRLRGLVLYRSAFFLPVGVVSQRVLSAGRHGHRRRRADLALDVRAAGRDHRHRFAHGWPARPDLAG